MKRAIGTVKPLEGCPRDQCRYWGIRISCGYDAATGKRIRPYERFEGSESEAYLRLMQIRIEHGLTSTTDMTVAEYFVGVYLPWAKGRVRLETYLTYEATVANHIVPLFGSFGLDDLQPYYVEAKLAGIEKPGARKNAYKTLRQGYRRAVRQRMAKSVVTDAVDEPKLAKKDQPVVKSLDMWDYIDAFEGDDMYLAVVLGFADGPRRSEILALDKEDIDWSFDTPEYLGAVLIRRSYHFKKGRGYFEDTKNERHRWLLFPRWCGEILYRHAYGGTGPLLQQNGERMRPDYITNRWRAVLKEKGLPVDMPFKNTRHSCGTMLVREDGIPLSDVQQLLGHTTIRTTESFYVQQGTESLERAAAAMSRRAKAPVPIGRNDGDAKIISWAEAAAKGKVVRVDSKKPLSQIVPNPEEPTESSGIQTN